MNRKYHAQKRYLWNLNGKSTISKTQIDASHFAILVHLVSCGCIDDSTGSRRLHYQAERRPDSFDG
ncbi:UNVERIFIED_CONTAM: hypothetical protein NO986_19710 [Comamonas sp. A-3]